MFQRFADISGFEIRIEPHDLITRVTGRHESYERAHRHPQTSNARPSAHHGGIGSNPRQRLHATIVFGYRAAATRRGLTADMAGSGYV